MSITQDLLAVGSQSHITLLDPRMSQPTIKIVNSIDPGQVCIHINYAQHCSYVLAVCIAWCLLTFQANTMQYTHGPCCVQDLHWTTIFLSHG